MQATKLELTINLKTAKALSLGMPLLGPADELIEKGAMSASGPKQTSLVAPHMSAFGCEADMTFCTAHVRF